MEISQNFCFDPLRSSFSFQPTKEPDAQDGLRPLLEKKVPEIFEELQTQGIVIEKTRLKLVKVCISDLVERHGL